MCSTARVQVGDDTRVTRPAKGDKQRVSWPFDETLEFILTGGVLTCLVGTVVHARSQV